MTQTKTIKLDQQAVKNLFIQKTTQRDVFEALMAMVYPGVKTPIEINGWPKCNSATWMAIAKPFAEFDRAHHPDVMCGGLWMNKGFEVDDAAGLADFEIIPGTYTYVGDPT